MRKEIRLKLDLNSSFTIKQISARFQQCSHGKKITLIEDTAACRYGTITYYKVTTSWIVYYATGVINLYTDYYKFVGSSCTNLYWYSGCKTPIKRWCGTLVLCSVHMSSIIPKKKIKRNEKNKIVIMYFHCDTKTSCFLKDTYKTINQDAWSLTV